MNATEVLSTISRGVVAELELLPDVVKLDNPDQALLLSIEYWIWRCPQCHETWAHKKGKSICTECEDRS